MKINVPYRGAESSLALISQSPSFGKQRQEISLFFVQNKAYNRTTLPRSLVTRTYMTINSQKLALATYSFEDIARASVEKHKNSGRKHQK